MEDKVREAMRSERRRWFPFLLPTLEEGFLEDSQSEVHQGRNTSEGRWPSSASTAQKAEVAVAIVKTRGGYKATTKAGRPLSKKAKTRREALKQLRAVEANKKRGKKNRGKR